MEDPCSSPRRPGGGYTHHGEPKTVAVYPLHRHARAWLASPYTQPPWEEALMQPGNLSGAEMEDH